MGKSIYKSLKGKKHIEEHYESYMASFEHEFEREHVMTRFGNTHVLVGGPSDGKPLFILQGGNCINPMTLSWFLPLLDIYRVYAPDTIGHPGYSDEVRISAKDDSFAIWVSDLMDHFGTTSSAFIGPSYGGGIILRLATYFPERIKSAILVSPAGIRLGSKYDMIKRILIPLLMFQMTSSDTYLRRITDTMSDHSMKEVDHKIIGDIFKHLRLEQDMPKLTSRDDLTNFHAPTMVIAGINDVFFPEKNLKAEAHEIIPNLKSFIGFEMGHFPSGDHLIEMNKEIMSFLQVHYS
ncbi:alpha/beta fold hydrolase [Pseudalkalibacillus sp. Hm43]|uniref:alpha/beta fold hydrolase n=1 Tax=Pseudalkalibacillus sp. Hm43 TaxID=3450742 RepID=UPI003F421133